MSTEYALNPFFRTAFMPFDFDEGTALPVSPNPFDGHRTDFQAVERLFRVTRVFLYFRHVAPFPRTGKAAVIL
jgi:hypothetical protein